MGQCNWWQQSESHRGAEQRVVAEQPGDGCGICHQQCCWEAEAQDGVHDSYPSVPGHSCSIEPKHLHMCVFIVGSPAVE